MCLRIHIGIQSLWCSLNQIYIFFLELIIIYSLEKGGGGLDADTIDGNNFIQVTHKEFVTHSQILIQLIISTM